ncbi:MAG TPA: hypothetical protein VFK15_09420 [Burkholderiales bacterium]|jgi:hypothetical protein|nr:hypothetical protein [Burkholderiales bacterium]
MNAAAYDGIFLAPESIVVLPDITAAALDRAAAAASDEPAAGSARDQDAARSQICPAN